MWLVGLSLLLAVCCALLLGVCLMFGGLCGGVLLLPDCCGLYGGCVGDRLCGCFLSWIGMLIVYGYHLSGVVCSMLIWSCLRLRVCV